MKEFSKRIEVPEDDYKNLLGACITLYSFLGYGFTKKEIKKIIKTAEGIEELIKICDKKTD